MPTSPWGKPWSIPRLKEQQQIKLSSEEEMLFQTWLKALPWYKEFVQKYKEQPKLNDPNYDYRAAWKAGVVPNQRNPVDNMYHWSDFAGGQMMKSPYHPTAWAEFFMRQYGINPDDLPPNDPRVLEYQRAWHEKYPPRR